MNEVKRWRANRPQRRLVLFGRPDPSGGARLGTLQPLRIDDPDNFEGLRQAIGRLATVD